MASTLQQDGETEPFPNNGRGVFIYTKRIPKNSVVEILLALTKFTDRSEPTEEHLAIKITGGDCTMQIRDPIKPTTVSNELSATTSEPGKHVGLEWDIMASYWISIDRDSFLIKYGKGYLMAETTYRTFPLNDKESKFVKNLFNPAKPLYLMVFTSPEAQVESNAMIDAEPAFQFKTRPLAGNLPPLVKDSSTVTLFDLDRGQYTFSDDLPTACQELYNILKGCELEYPENPAIKLSDAIRYSMTTEKMCLYKILSEKKENEEYFKDHAFIRIALGPDMLTSPGNPFMLELWPSKSTTHIHNHGAACGVIKTLFGRMKISIYNKATDPSPPVIEVKPLMTFDIKQGDFTWMDENWYQTHKVENITDDFCATLQSFRYRSDDNIQWPGHDYIQEGDHSESLGVFYPEVDMTFREMRNKVLKEYHDYLCGNDKDKSEGTELFCE